MAMSFPFRYGMDTDEEYSEYSCNGSLLNWLSGEMCQKALTGGRYWLVQISRQRVPSEHDIVAALFVVMPVWKCNSLIHMGANIEKN